MKKQILTLSVCLALTATSAFAIGLPKKVTTPKELSTTPKVIKTIPTTPSEQTFFKPGNQPTIISRDELKKKFEEKRAKERENLYTALGLSDEQKTKAEELDAKIRTEAKKYHEKIRSEAQKLRALQTKKASWFAVYKQKLALDSAKHQARKHFEAAKKSFEAILTKEQLAKFKVIDAARKEEMKKFKKQHKLKGQKGFNGHNGEKLMGPPPEGMAPMGQEPMGPTPPPPVEKK